MRAPFPRSRCLVVAGCMVGPDYKRPETTLPGAFARARRRHGDAARCRTTGGRSTTIRCWTSSCSDGLEHNTDVLRRDRRASRRREAALREAHAILFFPLDRSATRRRARAAARLPPARFATATGFAVGLSTSFEIDVWGRLRRGERSVRDQLLASRIRPRHGRAHARRHDRAHVLRGALARCAAHRVARRSSTRPSESLALAKKRSNAGMLAGARRVPGGQPARRSRPRRPTEIARQRATFVHQLGVLTGHLDLQIAPGTFAQIPIPPAHAAPDCLRSFSSAVPTCARPKRTSQAATERIGVAKGSRVPDALPHRHLRHRRARELDQLFSTGARTWSIGAGLIGPILDGGRYRARTEQAEAQARQAEGAYERTVRNAFRDVSDALSNVKHASETEVDLKDLVDQSRKALHLAAAALRARLLGVPRGARRAAHVERRAAHVHPQPRRLPVVHGGPHERPRRRLGAAEVVRRVR